MKKFITIGDIHGRDNWIEFEDIKILSNTPNIITDFDMYIFVGDYTDSYTETNAQIKENLLKLIQFKKNYPDNVILLLGNHDLHYMFADDNFRCSGIRPEMFFDLNEIFNDNKELFQIAYQYNNYIWTHAGLHIGWYTMEFPFNSPNIADDLNDAFRYKEKTLFDCGMRRGGFKKQGGPFWADKLETWQKPIRGYHQIVGHTPVNEPITNFPYKRKDTSVTYVDCVEKNKYYILEID